MTWTRAGTALAALALATLAGASPGSFYEMDWYQGLNTGDGQGSRTSVPDTRTDTRRSGTGPVYDDSIPDWARPGGGRVTGGSSVGDFMGQGPDTVIPGAGTVLQDQPNFDDGHVHGVPYPQSQGPQQTYTQALPVYEIRSGDTLWAIAQRECGDGNKWRNIYAASQDLLRSGNPNLIYPRERVRIACGAGDLYSLPDGKSWSESDHGRQVVQRAGGTASPFITHMPLPRGSFRISSQFGPRTAPKLSNGKRGSSNHEGLDLAAEQGTPIGAVGPGVVLRSGGNGGYGQFVEIAHPDPYHPNRVITRYGHMKRGSIRVQPGQRVLAGEQIGQVGSTGNSSGPHLHFEVRTPQLVALRPNSFIGLA